MNAADIATRALTDDLAAVLAAHEIDLSGLQRDPDVPVGYWMACRCGFRWSPVPHGDGPDQHRAHIATILTAHTTPDPDALRVRLAAVEAVLDKYADLPEANRSWIATQQRRDLRAALGASAHTTPDQQALTAAREAVAAASEVVAAARELLRVGQYRAFTHAVYIPEHARAWDRLAAALGSAEVES